MCYLLLPPLKGGLLLSPCPWRSSDSLHLEQHMVIYCGINIKSVDFILLKSQWCTPFPLGLLRPPSNLVSPDKVSKECSTSYHLEQHLLSNVQNVLEYLRSVPFALLSPFCFENHCEKPTPGPSLRTETFCSFHLKLQNHREQRENLNMFPLCWSNQM